MVTLENFFFSIFINIFVHFTKFTMEFVHWNILFCIERGIIIIICYIGEFQ